MRIAVLGTGDVGNAIGARLAELGHEVEIAGRATFASAAATAELAFLCVSGQHALSVCESVGNGLDGKVLVDVTNPMDWSTGALQLTVSNTDSLGEQVQRALPAARVVKTFNTMANAVMVAPSSVPGEHVVFICGDDAAAKADVTGLLGEIGWPAQRVIDLGDITGARATESFLHLWVRIMQSLGTGDFNVAISRS